ncbi:MAG: hypothetical protein EHM42_01090 [Planctomycetaceae bacterium]|nr:MAG: hypothetical protein EHM42_01090 [Planctomycetaceae bacterium]
MIARTPRERELYESRLKMERDEAARLELAMAEGVAKGRAEGRVEGRTEGRVEGAYAGRIQILQQLLGLPESSPQDLAAMGIEKMSELAERLQAQLRARR